jgi:DNA/RNA endonuclease YhcR with UshA esterase domain
VFDKVAQRESIRPGARLRATGKVEDFRGNLEIHPKEISDLVVLEAGAQRTLPVAGGVWPISSLTHDSLRQEVTIVGKVANARKIPGDNSPYILTISDNTGSIDVVFWVALADRLSDAQKAEVGDKVKITGELGEYRGNLQIRLEKPENLKTEKSAPGEFTRTAPAASSQPRPIQRLKLSQVATASVGQRVQIEGTVLSIELLAGGRRIVVKDYSGSATILLWDSAEGLKPEIRALRPSGQIKVVGTIAASGESKVVTVTRPEEILSIVP